MITTSRYSPGTVGGICIDHNDHVFGINRSDITALELRVGKVAAPPVIEYDGDGNLVAAWAKETGTYMGRPHYEPFPNDE